MKKILVIIALVLVVSTSIVAGTLAMYTTRIDNLTQGSTVAKEFVLLKGGTDTFTKDVKIAPGETTGWNFSVKNYNGAVVTETAMSLSFDVKVKNADGKSLVVPLVVSVFDKDGKKLGEVTSSGTINFADSFPLSATGQEKVYSVTVNWPSNNAVDINYAGAGYGTAVETSVTGTQTGS